MGISQFKRNFSGYFFKNSEFNIQFYKKWQISEPVKQGYSFFLDTHRGDTLPARAGFFPRRSKKRIILPAGATIFPKRSKKRVILPATATIFPETVKKPSYIARYNYIFSKTVTDTINITRI